VDRGRASGVGQRAADCQYWTKPWQVLVKEPLRAESTRKTTVDEGAGGPGDGEQGLVKNTADSRSYLSNSRYHHGDPPLSQFRPSSPL